MKNVAVTMIALLIVVSINSVVRAQNKPVETTPMPLVQENTLKACSDNVDNDNDKHVDCDDQDCEIYAICVVDQREEEIVDVEVVEEVVEVEDRGEGKEVRIEIVKIEEEDPGPKPETGRFCRDRIDNNDDGYIDCHEASCQRYAYCRKQMFVVPDPPKKAPGLFINFGLGVALPNFRQSEATTNVAEYGTNIPFDPDMGLMFSLKTGYLFLKWMGVGINLVGGATVAGNQSENLYTRDHEDLYKYQGSQIFGHIGGIIRFQAPYCRFVPYLDIAAGYSYMEYEWHIYHADNTWEAIEEDITYNDEYSDQDIVGNSYINTETFRHFTLALEPGFDFFVSARRFAIGLKAWLPIIASHHASTDNIGVMFSLTYTPMWREKPQLRPEYESTYIQR